MCDAYIVWCCREGNRVEMCRRMCCLNSHNFSGPKKMLNVSKTYVYIITSAVT